MTLLAEIADKMPTASEIVTLSGLFGIGCAALALLDRVVARALLAITLLIGGWFAFTGYREAFVEAGMRDAIWAELGWPYVIATSAAPFLPAALVAGVLMFRPLILSHRRLPLDAQSSCTPMSPD